MSHHLTDVSSLNRFGEPLTDRQRAVHRLLREGLTNKQIARALGISPKTVQVHVSAVMLRLGARNRTQAALKDAA